MSRFWLDTCAACVATIACLTPATAQVTVSNVRAQQLADGT